MTQVLNEADLYEPGAEGGSQPASGADPSAPPATPDATAQVPTSTTAGGVYATQPEGTPDGGTPGGGPVPTLAELQNQLCPNCHVGVLYVKRYDLGASHEEGQASFAGTSPVALPKGYESGGAYEVECAYCEWSHSFALNPGKDHGKARDGSAA